MPMKDKKTYYTLFTSLLSIGAFTFGGGSVIIPLMRKKMVEELGWLSEEDMLDMIAIAQSSPGAVSVNVAAQIGRRTAGIPGLILAVLATVLPPFVWLTVISLFYDSFRTSPAVDAVLRSMQPAVAAVILSASISMLKTIQHKERISTWMLFAGSFLLSALGVKAIYILCIGAAAGIAIALTEVKRHAA